MKGAKKRLVTLVSMFMMVATLGAMESKKNTKDVGDFNPHFYENDVIEFVERGIKFYIFLDGEFDFNTAPTAHVDYIYKNARRSVKHYSPRGIRIERDYQGRIRRIGNVFISYTWENKVKRIGSIFVKYHRNRMYRVGNLRILYKPYGIEFRGRVKGHSHYYYNPYYSYGWSSFSNWYTWDTWEYGYYDSFFDNDDFYNDYESFDEDDDYYYYRSRRNGKNGQKAQKGKIIKRKKAAISKSHEKRKKATVPNRILSKHRKRS